MNAKNAKASDKRHYTAADTKRMALAGGRAVKNGEIRETRNFPRSSLVHGVAADERQFQRGYN